MTTSEAPTDNGVNVQALLDARTALVDAPEGRSSPWRASNEWVRGTHSQSAINNFFGLGGEQSHRSSSVLRRRPPRGLRLRGQRSDAGRVRARRPGELPHRRRRRGRAEPRYPAQLGQGDDRGRHGHPRDPRRRPGDPERLQRDQGPLRHRRGRDARGDRGAGRPVAEALGRVRRGDEPDERDGARSTEPVPAPGAHDDASSSEQDTPVSPSATSSPGARSTTWSSSAGRWPTPGGHSAGTRCGCSRPTG